MHVEAAWDCDSGRLSGINMCHTCVLRRQSHEIICHLGINISEQKSGTEQTKKRVLVLFTPPGGATVTVLHRLDAINGFCPSYDNPGYRYPAVSRSALSKTQHFTILKSELASNAEHWKLVAESSEFQLTLNRVHFFQLGIRKKKRDISNLIEKRESGMALKKCEFTPERGNVMLTAMIDMSLNSRHATISWGKSVFFPWKSVSIRILHLCIDIV